MKIEKAKKEIGTTTQKPQILQSSREIGQRLTNGVPIYERFQKVLAHKQKKINELKAKIEKKREEDDPDAYYPTFKPNLNSNSRLIVEKQRQQQENAVDVVEKTRLWKQVKDEKNKLKQI